VSGAGGIQQGPVQFTPATSIKEAEVFAKNNGVKYPEFTGMGIEQANNFNLALSKVPTKAKPDFVANGAEWKKATDGIIGRKKDQWYGASSHTISLRYKNEVYLSGALEGDFQTIAINARQYKTIDSISERKKYIQNKYKEQTGNSFFLNTNGKFLPLHEMGHTYSNKKYLPKKWEELSARWHKETKIDLLKNNREAFAEGFADYLGNDGKKLPSYIKDFMDDFIE